MPFKIFAAVLALAILGMSVAGAYLVWKGGFVEEKQALAEIEILEGTTAPPDPGVTVFEKAMNLVREGEHVAARDILLDLVRVYKDSKRYEEAKRIIGEINMDLILSTRPAPGKKEHIVQSGDRLGVIAQNNNCSLDYIVRANGMMDTRIHPGEKIMVYPLELNLIVELEDKRATLMRNGRFVKEYKLMDSLLPPGVRTPVETTVKSKAAWVNGRSVRSSDAAHSTAEKWIQFTRPGLLILPGEESVEVSEAKGEEEDVESVDDEQSPGIFMNRGDVEELYGVLTTSTPITIVR